MEIRKQTVEGVFEVDVEVVEYWNTGAEIKVKDSKGEFTDNFDINYLLEKVILKSGNYRFEIKVIAVED